MGLTAAQIRTNLNEVANKTMANQLAKSSDALANHYTRQAPTTNSSVSARVLDANALAAAQAAAAAQNAQAAARAAQTPVANDTNTSTKKKSSGTKGTTTASSLASAYTGGGGGYSDGGGGVNSDPLALLRQNYNNSVNTVNSKYDAQVGELRSDAEKQLREAYINYMLNRKNSANDMARQGYTGGLTESNLARLYNNYGTIRNDINRRTDEAVNKYNLSRNAELLNLLNNYNNQQLRYVY